MDFLTGAYPWIKALHIVSVIAWMAAMLYMPRLFVYHAAAEIGSVQSETFKVMERRLARAIMLPAMVATLLFGGLLLATPGIVDFHQGWLHAKLTLVLAMLVMQHFFGAWRRAFAEDRNHHSQRFYRMINEVPTVLMIAIVILVVVKPF
ncbi:MAG: rane protein [Rhodospirillales bacterium]|nr:rane protein [Rhodospirillales bacterium]